MSVTYSRELRKFILTTSGTSYALGVDAENNLQHLYWGKRLPFAEDFPPCRPIGQTVGIGKNQKNPKRFTAHDFYYPYEAGRAVIDEEYPAWGGLNFVEPCLKATFSDGVRDVVLKYEGFEIKGDNELVITLKDEHYSLYAHLFYRIFPDVDLIVRWTEIENQSSASVQIESAQSAVWYAPDQRKYRLSYLSGKWGDEFNLQQTLLNQGKMPMESRRGITSHHATPWFALDPDGSATEHSGEVWFGTLAWSGNWKIVVETSSNQQTRVTGGIHDFDFAWELGPGETFQTPEFIGGYSEAGLGGASRLLHRYALEHVYPEKRRGQPWPVFYNTWETFWFDYDENKLFALAEKAAELGVEVFHVDDGWFGKRNDESAGLGDWQVNRDKFPHGLRPLVEKVKALGMDLSLWIEPENVNVDSELYRAHPDWVYRFPTRRPSLQRESLILNLSRPDVQEYVWRTLASLVREHDVRHLKWDLNRQMSEPGWTGLSAENQKELWVRHVRGVYAIKEKLKQEFPQLTLECCSGGGGRVDYGMLRYCETALASDNHDPLARLLIQEGYSYLYPAKTMGTWVTDLPSPLTRRTLSSKFMFHVAMMGAMGIQSNILQWNEEELAYAKEMIGRYKIIRPIIQEGDLYRLCSLRTSHIAAVQYVDRAACHSIIFAFMWTNAAQEMPPTNIIRWASPRFSYTLHLRGLIPERRYVVEGSPCVRSGESFMSAGLNVELEGDGDSALIQIDERKDAS